MNLRHTSTLGLFAILGALALLHHSPTRAIVALAAYGIAANVYAAVVLQFRSNDV